MSDKLWCQMCGKTVSNPLSVTCSYCGAVLVNAPVEDGLLEEVLLAKLAKRDALIERLIEAGNWLALYYEVARTKLSYDHPSLRIRNWRKLVDGRRFKVDR